MSFEEYLISKKVDTSAFQKAEPGMWQEWEKLFSQVSPASFTSQKLYLINPVRRRYTLKEVPVAQKKAEDMPSIADATAPSVPPLAPKAGSQCSDRKSNNYV